MASTSLSAPSQGPTSWFTIPSPIATLFKQVPLAIYAANDLPVKSPSSETNRSVPILFVFTDAEGSRLGAPSFNPSCLKWQTILRIARVPFMTRPSTNHASPTGALPFLLPTPSDTPSDNFPVAAGEPILNFAISNASPPNILDDTLTPRQEAYAALISSQVRPALLHALYLNPANSELLMKLYINPCSRNTVVRTTLLHQVRSAAEAEILSTTRRGFVDIAALYEGAKAAFSSLERALLGSGPAGDVDGFFSASDEAALFDAEVFSYTNTILDHNLGWVDDHLGDMLRSHPALTAHRACMLRTYFPKSSESS